MNRAVSLILLWGAILAGILMCGGTLLHFVQGSTPPEAVHSLSGFWNGLRTGHPLSVIELGIVVLMLTPIASVLAIGLGLLRRRDWRIAAAAFAILLVLLLSAILH